MKTRERILKDLKFAESEEGRAGIVDAFLAAEAKTVKKEEKGKK